MLISRRALIMTGLLAVMAANVVPAIAQAASPLGIGTAEPSFQTSGLFSGFLFWVNQHQQSFYRALTQSLEAMRDNGTHLWTLIGLSFAYGVFHAAGPGHGKAVISSYMIANETELRRGATISLVSALLQGIVAILTVAAAYMVLRGSGITLTDATNTMEIASYAMIILFGSWLLFRKLRQIAIRRSAPVSASLFDGPHLAQAGGTGLSFSATDANHGHDSLAAGATCPDCGITHLPDPAMLKGSSFSIKEAWSAIIAVGLRPCSGALLVMTFSILNGLYLGGILSVLAMSIGTAITVSLLATLAVTAKGIAVRLSGPGSTLSRSISTAIELLGALLVVVLGVILLLAALQS